jgi:hypothetical protein
VAKLYDAFGKLLANPWLGRAVPEALKATSRYRCGSHLIFHRWHRKQLYIIRILHESRITSSISADGWVRPTKRTIPRDSGARDRSLPHREKIVEVQ